MRTVRDSAPRLISVICVLNYIGDCTLSLYLSVDIMSDMSEVIKACDIMLNIGLI